MPTIYRVENPNSDRGLWYRTDGSFDPLITQLEDGQCADLPMGFDPDFKAGGLDWVSGCDSLPDMLNWFSRHDIFELAGYGYDLFAHTVSDYRMANGHAIFTRESVIETAKLDIAILTPPAPWQS